MWHSPYSLYGTHHIAYVAPSLKAIVEPIFQPAAYTANGAPAEVITTAAAATKTYILDCSTRSGLRPATFSGSYWTEPSRL